MELTTHTPSRLEALLTAIGEHLDRASTTEAAVHGVASLLRRQLHHEGWLPERTVRPKPDGYARHLVHRDPRERFSVVAMVWAPGQRTAVHDHCGVWCVEGVYAGRIAVTRYDMLEPVVDSVTRFRKHDRVEQGLGGAGCLIPPVEHHVIENPGDVDAVTLHVYGGELLRSKVYFPQDDGTYREDERQLGYTSEPVR